MPGSAWRGRRRVSVGLPSGEGRDAVPDVFQAAAMLCGYGPQLVQFVYSSLVFEHFEALPQSREALVQFLNSRRDVIVNHIDRQVANRVL